LPDGSVLLAVADGVGGMQGGETASAISVETLLEQLSRKAADDPASALAEAFSAANQSVRHQAALNPELSGMASTLVAALIQGDTAWVANAGDSRAYLFHNAALRQLTQDHTWVAERIRAGRLTPEEAENSPHRNVITRGVGVAQDLEPDIIGPIELPDSSLLLLCSDGLHRVADDADIAALLGPGPAQHIAERLIDLANERGGPDNISVAILQHNSR
jgi:protein phosphatase